SARSGGAGGTRQSPSRTARVSFRKSGSSPARSRSARACRDASSSSRSPPSSRWRRWRNSVASGVRTSSALIGRAPPADERVEGARGNGEVPPSERAERERSSSSAGLLEQRLGREPANRRVDELDRVEGGRRPARAAEGGGDLDEAARVGARVRIRVGSQDV